MQKINPLWHNAATAGMIGLIGVVALLPSPWEVNYRQALIDAVRGSMGQVSAASDDNLTSAAGTVSTDGIPPKVQEIAQKTARDFGIPLGIILAIAKHETGHFRAMIGSGNAWGIKCVGNDHSCTKVTTQEHTGGTVGTYRLGFESCDDVDRCSRILGQTLENLNTGGQWENVNKALTDIGTRYATDPQWSQKVIRLMD